MKVQVLGIGCQRCRELEIRVRDALAELNISADIEHVTDLKKFAAMGVFMTPGLVIDGKVVSQGKVPSKDELKKLLGTEVVTDALVCYCGKVTRGRIISAIRAGATTLEQIQKTTGAGVGDRCKELNPKRTCCIPDILAILKEETGAQETDGCTCPHCDPK